MQKVSWAAVVLVAFYAMPCVAAPERWEKIDERAGIELWQRPEADYTVATYRSRSVIAAPIAQLSAILWDTQRSCEWMTNCVESQLLEARGKDITVQYNRTRTSMWLPDHDVIIENNLILEPQHKSVRFSFHSVNDRRHPSPQWVVRVSKLDGFFLLHQLQEGSTEVIYQATIDPGGGVPAAILQATTLDMLVGVHQSLRRQAQKAGYEATVAQLRHDFDWSNFVTESPIKSELSGAN